MGKPGCLLKRKGKGEVIPWPGLRTALVLACMTRATSSLEFASRPGWPRALTWQWCPSRVAHCLARVASTSSWNCAIDNFAKQLVIDRINQKSSHLAPVTVDSRRRPLCLLIILVLVNQSKIPIHQATTTKNPTHLMYQRIYPPNLIAHASSDCDCLALF